MPREVNTPLILWICAAVCLHYAFGEGGKKVGDAHEDRSALWSLLVHARDRAKFEEQTFEVALLEPSQMPPDEIPDEPKKDETKPDEPKTDEEKKKDEAKIEPPKPEDKKPEPPKVDPAKKKADEAKKKEEEKKIVVVPKKEEEKKPEPPKDPLADKRIAVRQHADPNQKDNPDAKFIADQANRVKEETAATQTSHDKDDKKPTPGGNHQGPDKNPGDSEKTAIRESDENKGEKNRAPGEKGNDPNVQREPSPPMKAAPAPTAMQGPNAPKPPQAAGDGRPPAPAPQAANTPPPQPQGPQLAPAPTGPASPTVENSPNGSWSFNPSKPQGGTGAAPAPTQSGPGASRKLPPSGPTPSPLLGLGRKPQPGQVNLNLSQDGVTAVVGQDQLRKMREADGERRKSEHRGSWVASGFERWRSAIENYVSSVKPGNQTALNTAAVPFATYLNGMHNRIHPIFADTFLGSLDSLPKDHPLNNVKMITRLEIVLTKDGHLQKMGIVRTSGVTAFDIAALDSVQRASPFGPAPNAIVSPDGNVYLHWEFHRDEVYACSTMNARPYLINTPPKPADPQPPGAPPSPTVPTKERTLPPVNTHETREGMLDIPSLPRAHNG